MTISFSSAVTGSRMLSIVLLFSFSASVSFVRLFTEDRNAYMSSTVVGPSYIEKKMSNIPCPLERSTKLSMQYSAIVSKFMR